MYGLICKQRYFWSSVLPMLDAFDRIVSYFMVLVGKNWAKGPVYFWTKVRYYGQFVAHDTSARGVRGGGGAAAEATSVVYRRSSLLSKQASTSSLPLRLSKFSAFTSVAGEKGAFHTKLGSLQWHRLSLLSASSQLCCYCKIIDALVKFPAKDLEISNYLHLPYFLI